MNFHTRARTHTYAHINIPYSNKHLITIDFSIAEYIAYS
jgi:hypothetical protein